MPSGDDRSNYFFMDFFYLCHDDNKSAINMITMAVDHSRNSAVKQLTIIGSAAAHKPNGQNV